MGEAKRRGSFEQRVELAKKEYAEKVAAMPPEARMEHLRRRQSPKYAATLLTIAAASLAATKRGST